MKKEIEIIYQLVKKYGGVLTDDRHFMDDVDQILETTHNTDYAKYTVKQILAVLDTCNDIDEAKCYFQAYFA